MTEDSAVFGAHAQGAGMVERAYAHARAAGASLVRLNVGRDRAFTWDNVDRFVNEARDHRLQPYLTLTYTPPSSTGTPLSQPAPSDFGRWCSEAATRYAGRVLHWSVWNEPNLSNIGNLTPSAYAGLYRACRDAIKSVDGNAKVYYGEVVTAPGACDYIALSLPPGLTTADGIAIHTYQFTTAPNVEQPETCRGIGNISDWNTFRWALFQQVRMRTPQGGPVPIIISEHGYCQMDGECPPGSGAANRISESQRAQWTQQAFALAQQAGVAIFGYYHLVKSPDSPANGSLWDTGIVNTNGSRTPTIDALRAATGTTNPPAPDGSNAFADVTGDRLADAIAVGTLLPQVVRRSTSSAFAANEAWTDVPFIGNGTTAFADVTGDGKADAIAVNDIMPIVVRRSTGSGFAPNEIWTDVPFIGNRSTAFADVTGDGKADAIAVNDFLQLVVRRSTGSGFAPNEAWSDVPFTGNRGTFFADVTGDGKADVIAVNDFLNLVVRRSTGNGFLPNEAWNLDGPFFGNRATAFADVTGDGKADAIAVNDYLPVVVRRSTGSSFAANEQWTDVVFVGN